MKTLKTTLKTNLLGVLALIAAFTLVLGMSAFTSDQSKRDTYTFYYDGPVPALASDVEEEGNWALDTEGLECNTDFELACTITIDEAYVDDSDPMDIKLDASANLGATQVGANAYLSSSADTNADIINQAAPQQ
ncbi:hypothetical protein [Pedobacter helvus]|jgi:hypothetical protein|uniref:Uncharacterized protein n=1 Tax=Pedobacter helvus TaxID=2563444 RepID=A0ABW9JHS6_9SPHI|nr:hypothetical protein [Pedobacter ureilyticus]